MQKVTMLMLCLAIIATSCKKKHKNDDPSPGDTPASTTQLKSFEFTNVDYSITSDKVFATIQYSNGLPSKIISDGKCSAVYTYNGAKKPSKIEFFDNGNGTGKLTERMELEYNANGQIAVNTVYSDNYWDNVLRKEWRFVYTYNGNNLQKKEAYYHDENGTSKFSTYYTYSYDVYGNIQTVEQYYPDMGGYDGKIVFTPSQQENKLKEAFPTFHLFAFFSEGYKWNHFNHFLEIEDIYLNKNYVSKITYYDKTGKEYRGATYDIKTDAKGYLTQKTDTVGGALKYNY